jgi:membrane-bound ClpP family serine protease
MIDGWTIYWITILDRIQLVVMTIGIIYLIFGLLHLLEGEQRKQAITLLMLSLMCFNVFIFIPSTGDMAAIYVIPAIANSEEVQGESTEIYGLAKEWLRQQVDKEKPGIPAGSSE